MGIDVFHALGGDDEIALLALPEQALLFQISERKDQRLARKRHESLELQ